MDSSQLNALVAKYWKGETTLAEEKELREYFSTQDVPEELRETAMLFKYFQEEGKLQLASPKFDEQVINALPREKRKIDTRRWLYNSMRIAAGLLVFTVASYFVRDEIKKSSPQIIVDTYDDPQLAFEEAKRALKMISNGFNTAETQARKINLFNEAKQEIQRDPHQ
jgi:hypothetical protein